MLHVILCHTYRQGADYAELELGLGMQERMYGDVVFIYQDEDYRKLSTLSRDPNEIRVHDLTFPQVRQTLRVKGLIP